MTLHGYTYTFVIIKNPKQGRDQEPFLFFISDLQDAHAIANYYIKRWKIECCFRNLKKNGFNMEDIRLKADPKIELMVAILASIYVLAIMQGIIRQSKSPPQKKTYKNATTYLAESIFRSGYTELQRIFIKIQQVFKLLNKLLNPLLSSVS